MVNAEGSWSQPIDAGAGGADGRATLPSVPPLLRSLTAPGLAGALSRYRLLAYLVGTGLLVLTVIGVPLQYAAHSTGVVSVVGPLHGFLYIVYLVAGYDLTRRSRLTLGQLLTVIVAGFVPVVAFVVERWITRKVVA